MPWYAPWVQSGSAENRQPAAKVCPSCGGSFDADALFCPDDGTPLTNAASAHKAQQAPDGYVGRTILDHIEILQLAGVGAMGRVYRAFQKGVDRDVAVKILHRELSANEQLVARFHREAKVASRLQHPNVVHVHLAGQLPDGALYIAMEYLDGMSLQSALAAAGNAMDLPRTLHIVLQICDAVGEAHAQGVVHRDLKPENVMLVRRGADADFVKVLDFGIARLNWGEQSMATAAGLIFGTARYISPEGAQGEIVGPAGDVYGIATLLFQMLSGRTPFEGDQAVALLVQQIHDAPPTLRSIPRASYVPEPIANVIMRNLGKDPMTREPDGRALGRALLDAAKLAGLSADELVARPMLMGSRPSGAVQLAPMQRTRQLELTPDITARLAATAPMAPNQQSAAAALAAAIPTTTQPLARASFPTPTPAPPRPSGVDITLDDVAPPPRLDPTPVPLRTQMSAPLPQVAATPLPMRVPSDPGVRNSRPSYTSAPEPELAAPEEDEVVPGVSRRRNRSRAVFIFVACFLVGVIGSAAIAYKMGLVGQAADDNTLDHAIERANDALRKQHWDDPPGDNVLELTDEGLKKWPNDARLLDIRARATDEVVKAALGEKYLNHRDKAAKLAQLAHQLDPTDSTATMLMNELVGNASVDAGVTTDAGSVAIKPSSQQTFVATAPHATLDAIPNKPRAGQTIDVSARAFSSSGGPPKTPLADAELTITGPGLSPNTRLVMTPDASGVMHTTLTLFDPGKFDLTFSAKSDGAAVRVTKSITVTTITVPDPPGVDGGKWM